TQRGQARCQQNAQLAVTDSYAAGDPRDLRRPNWSAHRLGFLRVCRLFRRWTTIAHPGRRRDLSRCTGDVSIIDFLDKLFLASKRNRICNEVSPRAQPGPSGAVTCCATCRLAEHTAAIRSGIWLRHTCRSSGLFRVHSCLFEIDCDATTAIVVPLDITRQLLESQVSRLTTSGYRLLADIQSIYVTHAYAQKDTVSRLNSIHSGCNAELRAFFDVDRLTAGPEAAAVAFSRKAVLFKQWLTALIDRWQGLLQEALMVESSATVPAQPAAAPAPAAAPSASAGTASTAASGTAAPVPAAAPESGVTPPAQSAGAESLEQQQQQQQMQRKSSRSVLAKRPASSHVPAVQTYFVPPMVSQPVCVYANDPSSIIAFALSSLKHQDFVRHSCLNLSGEVPSAAAGASAASHSRVPSDQAGGGACGTGSPPDVPTDHVKYNPAQRAIKIGNHAASVLDGNSIEQSLTSRPSSASLAGGHKKDIVEIEFIGGDLKIFCRVYHACKFHALRRDILPQGEAAFLHSISRSAVWATTGGKSRPFESDSLDVMTPHYCQYVQKRARSGLPCCLAKIVGMFFLAYSNPKCIGLQLKGTYVLMENLLYNCRIDRVFDLKGSERNRHLTDDGQTVLLDQNFADVSLEEPLFVRRPEWLVLQRALLCDTNFLRQHNIMDYSLILGLADDQVICGIVDYIRDFTIDKMVEYLWKKIQSEQLPTVINPQLYQERFLAAMSVNFIPVPGHWDTFNLYECNYDDE
uniref:PIPK domain-containing protein n=1 Tax=Macrostomum lignano TaxID=282301 RepID=A0A1I8FC03_9PLAT